MVRYDRKDLARIFGVSYTTIEGVLRNLDKPWCITRRQGRRTLYTYEEDVIEFLERLGYEKIDESKE
ncbi:MAG TPA: hypothetical protein PLD93_03215 [Synergistaceae bacterium]|jgi:DNA-binding GntR family transcriptional regulator|nr:hypothetical protein [Synergistaceae bacterium]